MQNGIPIGEYLIQRLLALGADHVFGIPGDYVLGFYDQLVRSEIRVITTCDEQGAGFAADAYARLKGIGVVCITYCVGGLKVANPVAGAFAEKSPVVVISGAPGIREREKNPLLHHKVRDFETQRRVFSELTVASTVLDDPETALAEIDRVLHAAVRYKRPVYIELPRDMAAAPGRTGHRNPGLPGASDPAALEEALSEAIAMLNASKQPVIIADVEIHRFGLQDALLRLVEKTHIPVAATILGKSVIAENHPSYIGVYEGAMGQEAIREYVESSDCLLLLGFFMTDINLGGYTAHLDLGKAVRATSEKLSIRHHSFEDVSLEDFLDGLIVSDVNKFSDRPLPKPVRPAPGPRENAPMTIARLFACVNEFINEQTIVIADVGDALFGASDLFIQQRTEFLGPAYYASMGFAVPAAVGAQMARPALRPLVLVGDGAFQMTGMELSTAVRCGLAPIVIVLNNAGYGTERQIHEGPYNDILPWKYHRIPEILGAGAGFKITSTSDLDDAFAYALQNPATLCVFDVQLDKNDHSPALGRLTERLSKRI